MFDFKDFSQIDVSNDSEFFIDSMIRSASHKDIVAIKSKAVEMLLLDGHANTLDVGCGPGTDVAMMANLTNNMVIGIDNSQKMIDIARQRTTQENVQFQCADANNLPFVDNHFSHVRMDRLMVSQQDPAQTFYEAVRVLQPGGRLCVTELDFATIVLFPFDSAIAKLVNYWQKSTVKNPYLGRQLQWMFQDAGFIDIALSVDVYRNNDFDDLLHIIKIIDMIDGLHAQGFYSLAQAQAVKDKLWHANNDNHFLYTINFYTVCGVKPY